MATFQLKLDTRKRVEKDKYHLTVCISHLKNVAFLRLGKTYSKKEFDIFFKKRTLDKTLLELRNHYNSFVDRAVIIFEIVKPYDIKKIRSLFYDKNIDLNKIITNEDRLNGTISFLFNNYIKIKKESYAIGESTCSLMKYSGNTFNKFKNGVTYKEITPEFLSTFENWFLNQKNVNGERNSIATVANHFRNLRAVLNFSFKKKIIPSNYELPFLDFKIPNYVPPKKVITIEEIQKIIDFNEFENHWDEYARDIWVLLYRMHGINFIDLLKLEWNQMSGNHFIFFRTKTLRTRRNNIRPLQIKITEKIKSLIDKIGDPNSPFVLGLIENEKYTETYLKNRNNKLKKKINKHLKIISNKINLSIPLDISLARDCYANTLKRNNINPLVISENMNHSDPRITTLHYLDQFDQNTLDDANDVIR